MDVAVWLRGLGLQQYEALFRENDIDAEVLSDLTDGDLEKIGVSLGHRKRLLKAVAALAGSAAAPPAAAAPIPPVADAAERRQLTVMFCDRRNRSGGGFRHGRGTSKRCDRLHQALAVP